MAKKKKGRPQGTGGLRACPEVQDELLALKAIYGHDLNVSPDGKTFTLALSYAVDGPEQRTVGCKLQLSLPSGYPILPISVRVHSDQHLSSGSTGALAQALSRSAERWAGEGLVCAFELIQEAQEWLADQAAAATKIRAAPPSPAASSSEASSYDEASDGSDEDETLEQAFWAPRPSFDPGLFADDGVDAETQAFPGTRAPRLGGSTPARAVGGAVAKSGPSLDGASPARPGPSAAAKSLEGVFAASFAGAAAPGLDSGSASDGCPSSSSSAASSPTPSLSGPSRTRSAVLSTVRQRLSAVGRAVLPLSLHRFLEPETSGEGTAPGASSAQAEASEQESRAALRRDLLLGHLLYKVLGDGLDSRAASGQLLEAVLRPLAADGIVPRWVAWALAQHPEVLRRAFERLFKEERARAGGGRARAFWRMGTRQQAPAGAGCGPSPISALPASRYASDFAELHRLGRGGFGVVVSAMNRMDGRMYAVKKIPMQDRAGSAARILREVTTLSRLQHPHVVRYFQAWAETAPAAESRPGREKERPAKPGEGSGAISSLEWWQKRSEESEEELEGSESEEELSTITESSDEDDEEGLSSGLKAASSSCRRPASSSSCRRPASSSSLPLPKHRRTRQLLYIQMEYCPRTLQGVLSTPDALGDAERWQVLRQVLSALAYIHSQGVIHRDLKPANIFYDARGDVRLGDFGLAKHSGAGMEAGEGGQSGRDGRDGIKGSAPREPQDSRSASLPPLAGEHTTGVGTQSYISPEIAEGWPTYDERVDLYSLGVVALELWAGFRTGMERALSLRRLREQGELPAELEEAQPAVCRLIRWLASPRPEGRPTAKEALASNLLPPAVNSVLVSDVLRSLPEAPEVQERVLSALFALGGGESSAGDKDAGASEQEARPGQATGDIVPANRRPALPASLPPTAHPASSQLPFWAPEDLRPGAAPAGTPTPQQRTLLRAALARALEEVLARHGALRTASAELGAPARGGGPEVLTRGGACLALRSECRAPLVAWAARRADELPWGFRRLEVCTVWKAGGSGGAPQAVWQAEIDFVAPRVLEEDRAREAREGGKGRRRGKRREEGGGERRGQDRDEGLDRGISQNDAAPLPPALVPSLPASDPPQLRAAVARQLPLAELALACCASLARFRELEPLLELRLSHRALPSLLFLSGRDGQPEDGPAAAEALALFARQASPRGPARAARWPRLEASLRARSRVGEEMLGRVRALVLGLAAAQGEPAGTLRALRALLAQRRPGAPASAALGRALEALESLAQAVQAWGAGRLAVVIDPWLAVWDEPGCAFGLFAAASAEGSSAQARLLGAGGRTDAAFARAGGRACELGGVGATLNLDRAVRLLAQAGAGAGPGALPGGLGAAPALDAVVGVRGGGGLLLERLALVRLLREGGLSAELAPGLAPSAREQFGAAAGRGAAWLVVLHAASFLADNTVHVKLLGGRVEEDVPLEELVRFLQRGREDEGGQRGGGRGHRRDRAGAGGGWGGAGGGW